MLILLFQYKEIKLLHLYPLIPENEAYLTHKDTELSELPADTGMGMAHRTAGHMCSTANVTEMSKATETQQKQHSLSWEDSSKVLGQTTYLPQLERFIQAGVDISTAHEPYVNQELVWCGLWGLFEDRGKAGMARGPAQYAVCRCCACPSISRWNLVQNSKTV